MIGLGVNNYFQFAQERYRILLRRQGGEAAPWTSDEVLQSYRFCNVFRENDRTTMWFRSQVSASLGDDHVGQLRAAIVFRYLNRIDTGKAILSLLQAGSSLGLEMFLRNVERMLRGKVAAGEKILGAAYMIKTPLRKDKVTGLLEIWNAILPREQQLVEGMQERPLLKAATEAISTFHYNGPFMAYEIVTDLRHTPLLNEALDIMTWANPGPGAMRGAARVLGLPAEDLSRGNNKHVAQVMRVMRNLLEASQDQVHWPRAWPSWEMRDVEHVLCEFDKYERARLGEGRPKQTFNGRGTET